MVKARGIAFLDGNFHPTHEVFSLKRGDAWTVVKRGPTYANEYEVAEFDADGLAWLEKIRIGVPGAGEPETTPNFHTRDAGGKSSD